MRDAEEAKGHTMPGGAYPIASLADLARAKQAFGRAKNPAATRRWINQRAKELGAAPLGSDVGKALSTFVQETPMSKSLKKALRRAIRKADPVLSVADAQRFGIAHSTSDLIGSCDARTNDQKEQQLTALINQAMQHPPIASEDHEQWIRRIFGSRYNQLYSDQVRALEHLYTKLKRHCAVSKRSIEGAAQGLEEIAKSLQADANGALSFYQCFAKAARDYPALYAASRGIVAAPPPVTGALDDWPGLTPKQQVKAIRKAAKDGTGKVFEPDGDFADNTSAGIDEDEEADNIDVTPEEANAELQKRAMEIKKSTGCTMTKAYASAATERPTLYKRSRHATR